MRRPVGQTSRCLACRGQLCRWQAGSRPQLPLRPLRTAAAAGGVVPGVAPSAIGSAAASTEAPAASVASVGAGAGGVTPDELGGVEAGVPDGRAVEGL